MSKLSYTKIPTEYRWHKTKKSNSNTPVSQSRSFEGKTSSVTFKVI